MGSEAYQRSSSNVYVLSEFMTNLSYGSRGELQLPTPEIVWYGILSQESPFFTTADLNAITDDPRRFGPSCLSHKSASAVPPSYEGSARAFGLC